MSVHPERLVLAGVHNPVRGLLCGTGLALSAVGGVYLWTRVSGDPLRQLALLAFVLSLLALYATSAVYHSVPWSRHWKQRLQRLDHAMIYVLIAGTYTPICYVVLEGALRWAALGGMWSITALGVAQKVWLPQLAHGFSIGLQIAQGWLGLLLLAPLAARLPPTAVWLTIAGGALYTLGAILFVTERPRLWPRVFSYHEVFHLCVVSASATHYTMILWFVVPLA